MRVSTNDPSATAIAASESPQLPRAQSKEMGSSRFAQVLSDLGREIDRDAATVRAAAQSMRAGADFGPARLIALQMCVYRYGEAIDLVSRVVDRAAGGVKTIVQGSGQ
jgi:hypothetical protein